MKKLLPYILILTILLGLTVPIIEVHALSQVGPCLEGYAQDPNGAGCVKASTNTTDTTDKSYHLLAPLPCDSGSGCVKGSLATFDPTSGNGNNTKLGEYLNIMIRIFIGLCAVLAMIMIVVGGIEYMTSGLPSGKTDGKERITQAILGLVLALGSWLLLNTINPDILNTDLKTLADVTVDVGGESTAPFVALKNSAVQSAGVNNCTGSGGKNALVSIGQQFVGKTSYTQDATKRNTFSGSTYYGDCSSTVGQIYACAGLSNPGGNTNAIFGNGATAVTGKTFDFTKLHPGDLVGWKQGDSGSGKVESSGHVAIYIGNGQILDNQPGGTAVRQLSSIQNRITYVKWPTN